MKTSEIKIKILEGSKLDIKKLIEKNLQFYPPVEFLNMLNGLEAEK